jgi:hypothetical protein
MTLLSKTRLVTMGALFAGVAVTSSVLAGEAIIVPGEKSKSAPAAETRTAPREIFRLRDTGSMPFDALTVPMMPERNKPLDPKEEKRRRLQQIEQKNWMVVGQGELQAEEEAKSFLNVRDYSLDGIEKQDETGNLMFRPISKDDTRRIPGQFRSPGDNARQAGRNAAREEEESQNFSRPERDPQLGAHMSSELNFRNLFETKQTGGDSLAPTFNKSELSLHSLLNSGSPEIAREQQARREEFRNFLNKPANPLAGPSDPINSRDLTGRQPLNPTMAQPLGGSPFGSSPGGISRPNSGLSAGLPNFTSGRPGFSAGSFLTPQQPARGAQRPPLNIEPPKRKF